MSDTLVAEPVTLWDRVLDDSGYTASLIAALLMGLGLLADGVVPGFEFSTTLDAVADVVKLYGGAVLSLGSVFALYGMLSPPRDRFDMRWAMERVGWIMVSATIAALLLSAVFARGGMSPLSGIVLGQWLLVGALRLLSLRVTEKEHRRVKAIVDQKKQSKQ